ncbi:MAG: Lrp/AsnC family transcriptional regulator [Oscillospiraceae bacterium]|nr:Lrp/AsnC family transcriptional regulator [Oscillospiraceae bacterium]
MDNIDEKILTLLAENARMPVKDIAKKVALTAPAVSQRIHRLEKQGRIAGYTLRFGKEKSEHSVSALISMMSLPPDKKPGFLQMVASERKVERCYNVTGTHSYIIIVCCEDMEELEKLLGRLQKWGQTSTQIILSTPVDRTL